MRGYSEVSRGGYDLPDRSSAKRRLWPERFNLFQSAMV